MIPAREFAGYLFESYTLPFADPFAAGVTGAHVTATGADPATFGGAVHDMGAGFLAAPGAAAPVQPASIGSDVAGAVLDKLAPLGLGIAGTILGGALVALGLYAFARG